MEHSKEGYHQVNTAFTGDKKYETLKKSHDELIIKAKTLKDNLIELENEIAASLYPFGGTAEWGENPQRVGHRDALPVFVGAMLSRNAEWCRGSRRHRRSARKRKSKYKPGARLMNARVSRDETHGRFSFSRHYLKEKEKKKERKRKGVK